MYFKSGITFRQLVRYGLTVAVVLLLVGYALFQARLLIIGPVITLIEEPTPIQHERVVELSGKASNIVTINLNGRQIYTDKNGYFKEAIILENGYTVVTLTGKDRYGRTVSLSRSFVYTPITNDLNNNLE